MARRLTAGVGVLLIGVLVLIGWPFLVAVALIGAGGYVGRRLQQWRALRQFRRTWRSQGKDLLIVYSDSPHWHDYIRDRWLPKWGERAVVLNWSERKHWRRSRSPEAAVFRAFAGVREFNPLGIVVPEHGAAVVVRFWRAFRDFKHGKEQSVRLKEEELERALAGHSTGA
jgi:hypothetical protein